MWEREPWSIVAGNQYTSVGKAIPLRIQAGQEWFPENYIPQTGVHKPPGQAAD